MGLYANYIFPHGMDWIMSRPQFSAQRVAVLSDVEGEVLEIGFGTGLNLPHYPATVKSLTALEPNTGMRPIAERHCEHSTIDVNMVGCSGEALPMDDKSFDVVVSTWTLCSIPDVAQALREVRRVLRPGGRFIFLEHGLSPDPVVARWQHRLNPLQKIIGAGCHLDRNMRELVMDTGFNSLSCDNFYFEKTPRILGYMYKGMAIR